MVGTGSAGCVVAARLSGDAGSTVLLLEAGGEDRHLYLRMPLAFLNAMTDARFNWTYLSQPEPQLDGRRLPLPRGRVVSGSGSINGMFARRGHPADYDRWTQMGARGGSFADVLPYFRKLENSWRGTSDYHGTGGLVAVRPIDSPQLLHAQMMATARAAGFGTSDDLSGRTPRASPAASRRLMRAAGG